MAAKRKGQKWSVEGTWEPYPGFSDDIRLLARYTPLGREVKIRIQHLKTDHGMTDLVPRKDRMPEHFRLTLSPAAGGIVTRDTLVHEWAHALSWPMGSERTEDAHGPFFGVAYAQCYRVVTYRNKYRG